MSQTREIACTNYMWEGECLLGRKGTFRDACQTCKNYQPKKNGLPARMNLKTKKQRRQEEKDIQRIIRDYTDH